MQYIPEIIAPALMGFAVAVALLAGFVKGAVGFGMPMIMISGLGSFLSPEIALAALIIPTVVSNLWQAFRGGALAAWQSMVEFRLFLVVLLIAIAITAQFVTQIAPSTFFLVLGIPITIFAASQLFGWQLRLKNKHRFRVEVIAGAIAGSIGGLSGIWGPTTVAYLTAIETPKTDQVRVQGVVYGAGAIVLLVAHLRSGILNSATMPLSLWLLVPALVGLVLGFRLQDKLDQALFRRVTLVVLIVAGLNLVRRAFLV